MGKLTDGEIAAIGAAVGAAVLFLCLLLYYYYCRKCRRKKDQEQGKDAKDVEAPPEVIKEEEPPPQEDIAKDSEDATGHDRTEVTIAEESPPQKDIVKGITDQFSAAISLPQSPKEERPKNDFDAAIHTDYPSELSGHFVSQVRRESTDHDHDAEDEDDLDSEESDEEDEPMEDVSVHKLGRTAEQQSGPAVFVPTFEIVVPKPTPSPTPPQMPNYFQRRVCETSLPARTRNKHLFGGGYLTERKAAAFSSWRAPQPNAHRNTVFQVEDNTRWFLWHTARGGRIASERRLRTFQCTRQAGAYYSAAYYGYCFAIFSNRQHLEYRESLNTISDSPF